MSITSLLPSWELALGSGNKSPKTITSYLASVRSLSAFLRQNDMPDGVDEVAAEHIRAFLVGERERTSPAYSQQHYRNLHVYFRWLTEERERTAPGPMDTVQKPHVPEKLKPFLTAEEQNRLLKVTSGRSFEDRRDHAVILILVDNGVRVTGLANLRFNPGKEDQTDVFLAAKRLRVVLKGGRQHWIPIGRKTAAAIDRYLRERARQPRAYSPWLWLGVRDGPRGEHFSDTGIRQMLKRRGLQAGVQDVHPHRFRHTFADAWLAGGGNVDDLMAVAGWESVTMPLKYAKGRGIERAAVAHSRLSPADRL